MSRTAPLLAWILSLLLLSACAPSVALGEEVELLEGDTIVIAGAGMRIRLDDVGHGWYGDGTHFPIVSLTVSYGGSTEEYLIEDTLEVGEYRIDISRVFEPEGRCSIVVTRR